MLLGCISNNKRNYVLLRLRNSPNPLTGFRVSTIYDYVPNEITVRHIRKKDQYLTLYLHRKSFLGTERGSV